MAARTTSPILVGTVVRVASPPVRDVVRFASNADAFDLAASIEKGAPISGYPARASLTVTFAPLDAAAKTVNAPLAESSSSNAIRVAEHQLRCNPLDSNAWLRYAMLKARIGWLPASTPATSKAQ